MKKNNQVRLFKQRLIQELQTYICIEWVINGSIFSTAMPEPTFRKIYKWCGLPFERWIQVPLADVSLQTWYESNQCTPTQRERIDRRFPGLIKRHPTTK